MTVGISLLKIAKTVKKMIDCSKAKNYLTEWRRMTKQLKCGVCKLECADCPLGRLNNGVGVHCSDFETLYPEKAIEIVQKWSDEHPRKTYLSEFLKNYPNAELDENGIPKFCLWKLSLTAIKERNCREGDCVKCWNQSIEDDREGEEND